MIVNDVIGRFTILAVCWHWIALAVFGQQTWQYVESTNIRPPPVPLEFRGAWVATVGNIDWPSKPGLPAARQKAEFVAILDRLVQMRMNAVILQVRPTGDAFYESKLEPWSYYLTGQMGRQPEPFYDPLTFAVDEAHRRGLELHAWFNPFRALHPSAKGGVAINHISRLRPDLTRKYGSLLWSDPGEPEVQAHSLRVILDVVRRYNVDGIHIDDYFYPYPEKTRAGNLMPFPDQNTWMRYRRLGGQLDLKDWRRDNVNRFVKRLYDGIKQLKPWVRFGISPFGIWRPGYPEGIKGMDAYDALYADALTWWQSGWVDYLAPQLYWDIDDKGQSFPALLNWWAAQNKQQRHLWPGIAINGTTGRRHPYEVLNQISATRRQRGTSGELLWGMNTLLTNGQGVAYYLQQHAYQTPAIPPPSTWLTTNRLAKPLFQFSQRHQSRIGVFTWATAEGFSPKFWLWQEYRNKAWAMKVFPGQKKGNIVYGNSAETLPDIVALTPIDHYGQLGLPCAARRIQPEAVRNPVNSPP